MFFLINHDVIKNSIISLFVDEIWCLSQKSWITDAIWMDILIHISGWDLNILLRWFVKHIKNCVWISPHPSITIGCWEDLKQDQGDSNFSIQFLFSFIYLSIKASSLIYHSHRQSNATGYNLHGNRTHII